MYLEEEPSDVSAEDILDAVTNKHDRRILAMAQRQPVEAKEIIRETQIARSTVYRRLSRLLDRGLIEIEEAVMRNGHRVERYRSALCLLALLVTEGGLETRWALEGEGSIRRRRLEPPGDPAAPRG